MPLWVVGACFCATLLTVYLLPTSTAKAVADTLIASDQAKLVAAAAGVVGFAVIVVTAYQIKVDFEDRADERVQRRADAIERQWTRLLAPAVGNTGKGEALTNLMRAGIAVDGVDVSCRAVGNWDQQSAKCQRRVIFTGVSVRPDGGSVDSSDRYHDVTETDDLDFGFAEMKSVEIVSHIFTGVTLEGASISGSIIVNSAFNGSLQGLQINDGRLINTIFDGDAAVTVRNSEVSGSLIPGLDISSQQDLRSLSAWADAPPTHAVLRQVGVVRALKVAEPYGPDVLNSMSLCAPPKRADGGLIPIFERAGIQGLGGFGAYFNCTKVTADQARQAYPGSYKRSEVVFGYFRARALLDRKLYTFISPHP